MLADGWLDRNSAAAVTIAIAIAAKRHGGSRQPPVGNHT